MQHWLSRVFALTLVGVFGACTGQVGTPVEQSNSNSNSNSGGTVEPCDDGYARVAGECLDIDECLTVACGANATCQNQPGSYACVCNTGFQGDGTQCTALPNRCDDMAAILASDDYGCVGCHDQTPGDSGGGLDLLSEGVELRLLNQRSRKTSCRNELLIDATDWQNSMILKLVDPTRYAAWGDDPCTQPMPFVGTQVSEADIECFEQWVQTIVETTEAPPPLPEIPFDPMPVESAVAKTKFLVHGGPLTDAELAAAQNDDGELDQAALRRLIQEWMSTPQFERKVRDFLQLSLQQYEINPRNQRYRDQFDPITNNNGQPVAIDRDAFFANLEASFVRTAWNIVSSRGDFRDVVTTRRWQVTTAMLAALVYADRSNNGRDNRFAQFAHLTPADYSDWRDVTFTAATDESEVPQYANNAAFAASLRSIPDGGSLPLRAPRVGFFNTPTFFESWETNEDNQFRVTANQAVLTALDILFEAGDTTPQSNLNGLAEEHAQPETACYQCHRLLDPMRLEFSNVYTYRYRVRDTIETELAPSFAFQGYTAAPLNMDEFAQALVSHPRFPVAWVQKLCMWTNSQRCVEDDPEFVRLVNRFSADYDFMGLLLDMLTSPLVTGAEITDTHDGVEFFISVGRSNHMCNALETRIRAARADRCSAEGPDAAVCQVRDGIGCDENNTTRSMAQLISSDAYGRGAREFIQESVSGPFNARAMTELCTELADREVGGGNRTFSQQDISGSLDRMVEFIMGLPPTHPRYATARAVLQRSYDIGVNDTACPEGTDVIEANRTEVVCGYDLSTTRALYIPWILACSSPELAGQGL